MDNKNSLLELDKKTQKIDKLINKTNSGKNAWEAGKLLHGIKELREYQLKEFKNFGIYTNNDLRISETKALNYINIYLLYEDENLSSLILVTHLLYLAKQDEDIRNNILTALMIADEKTVKSYETEQKQLYLYSKELKNSSKEEKIQIRPDYDKDVLIGAANLLEAAKISGETITNDLAIEAIKVSVDINRERSFQHIKLPNKLGLPLNSIYFPDIPLIYKFEPTNEMGVVALFCTMFHKLLDLEFEIGKQKLKFKSIIYVREEFPDSQIEFFQSKKSTTSQMNVEFEFLSNNYILHEHNKSSRECDLIIAWSNNINKKRFEKFGVAIPPIISIKKILETGKITVE